MPEPAKWALDTFPSLGHSGEEYWLECLPMSPLTSCVTLTLVGFLDSQIYILLLCKMKLFIFDSKNSYQVWWLILCVNSPVLRDAQVCGECNSWVCQDVPRRDYPLNWLMLLLLVARSCLTLCDPMDSNPPGSSVRGILQARTLEWVAISSSKWYSWPRDRTCLFYIGRQILYHWALSNVDGYHPVLWGPG